MSVPSIITRPLESLVSFDTYLSDKQVLTDNNASYVRKTQVMVYSVAKPILLIFGAAVALASMIKPIIGVMAGVFLYCYSERVRSSNLLAKTILGLAALAAAYFQPTFTVPMLMAAHQLEGSECGINEETIKKIISDFPTNAEKLLVACGANVETIQKLRSDLSDCVSKADKPLTEND